jgi:hypothetical protein
MESYSGWTQVLIEGVITPNTFRYPRKSLIVAPGYWIIRAGSHSATSGHITSMSSNTNIIR